MSEIYIDSASLRDIRRFLELRSDLQKVIGLPARFKVVLDANIAVADLMHKLNMPNVRQTAIEECVTSGVLEVHAPRWLDEEIVTRTIPKVARDKKIDPASLLSLWEQYREMLIWDEALRHPEGGVPDSADVDDIPYITLAGKIDAVGILSRDKHIAALGGTPLKLEFALTVRRYARAASVHLSIYVNGTLIGAFGFSAIMILVRKSKDLFMELPPIVRTLLIIGLAISIIHPGSRKWIYDKIMAIKELGGVAWPEILSLLELAAAKQLEAESELNVVNTLIKKTKFAITP